MRERILQIIPTLDRSGAEKQLVLLATGLPRDEFDVEVVALTRSVPLEAELAAAGIPVTLVGKRGKLDPTALWRLKQHIAARRPSLVHTWLFAANSYGRAAAIWAGVPKIVAGERCVDPWKGRLHFTIDRRLARRTDRIVTNSPGVRDFYTAHGIPAEKFTIIPNAAVLPKAEPVTRAALLEELQLPPDIKLIAAIGRLWPQKRVKDLIWAADLLKVARPEVHLLIIGDGPQRARLERFRDQVEIADRVHFLGHRSDVPRLLPHVDVLWLASAYEGQPNVVLEAMQAGVPVVATNISGTRELVVEGETGFLVPIGDRAAFARQTEKFLANRDLARQFGAAAQRRVAEHFSVERMVQAHAALYRELLAK